MLSETKKGKENQPKTQTMAKEICQGFLQGIVGSLKEEIQLVRRESYEKEKNLLGKIDQLNTQVAQYKKRLNLMNDKYLAQSLTKIKNGDCPLRDYEKQLRDKEVLLDQQRCEKSRLENEITHCLDQNNKLKRQIAMGKLEREKNMQISLVEKIQLQEKMKILEQDLSSKKKIMGSMKKQIQKLHREYDDVNKKERQICQKTKELDCFSQEMEEYYKLNGIKMTQQVSHLTKENDFLKTYVKKLQKMAKKGCNCEEKDEKIKENLYEIKRQLALAKVQMSKSYLKELRQDQLVKKWNDISSDSEGESDIQRRKK